MNANIEFKLWGSGFRIPTSKGRPISFVGTMEEVFSEMERLYIEAGEPKNSCVVAEFYGGHQTRFPKLT